MVPSVAFLEIARFFTLFYERQDFRKHIIGNKICVLVFSTILSETFLVLRRIRPDIFISVNMSSYNITLLLSDFKDTRILWTEFRKILKYQIS